MQTHDYLELTDQLRDLLQKPLFFIVGCQRSGNTWLEHLLNGHPEICCLGETLFVPCLLPVADGAMSHYNKEQTAGQSNTFGGTDLEYLFTTMMLLLMRKWDGADTAKCIGEKSPEHALYMPVLHAAFPHARHIHIIRDGRDVAVSGWFHNLHTPSAAFRQQGWRDNFPAYAEHHCSNYWVPYVGSARKFGQEHPDQHLEVRYEKLHGEPEPTVERILQFLGVDASSSAVATCLEAGSFERLAKGRRRGDEDRGAFYRKGVVGDWRNHFDDVATAAFMRHGGELLEELGYV